LTPHWILYSCNHLLKVVLDTLLLWEVILPIMIRNFNSIFRPRYLIRISHQKLLPNVPLLTSLLQNLDLKNNCYKKLLTLKRLSLNNQDKNLSLIKITIKFSYKDLKMSFFKLWMMLIQQQFLIILNLSTNLMKLKRPLLWSLRNKFKQSKPRNLLWKNVKIIDWLLLKVLYFTL